MKMFFTCCMAAFMVSSSLAQPNNPYDQAGKDFVKSCQLLFNEIKNGNVKDADEATIKKMQEIIPSKTQMNASLAGHIIKHVKQDPLPFASIIKNSPLKPDVQREISLMLEHSFVSDDVKHRAWLTEKTESLLKSSFGQGEKELLLHLVAIQFHQSELNNMGRVNCSTRMNGEIVKQAEGMDCAGAAAFVGFTIGYAFCGFYCGLGGAVIGFATVLIGEIS